MSTRVNETIKPWDRQPGESQQAFSAFSIWLRLANRSPLDAYRQYSGQIQATSRPGYFRNWMARWRWSDRAQAYDTEVLRLAHQAEVERVLEERRLWDTRRKEVIKDEWEHGTELIAKAREMLQFPVSEQRITETQNLSDGRTVIQHITIKPGPWRSRDAGYMIALGAKMRRLAADMATDRIETIEPITEHDRRLKEARRALTDARELAEGIEDQIVLEKVASAFGLTVEELIEPDAEITDSQLVM